MFNANVGDVIFDSDNNKYEVVERKKKEINKFKMINKAPPLRSRQTGPSPFTG